MTLGAEPKKVAILIGLVVLALGGLYMNSTGDSTSAPAPRALPNSSPAAVVSTADPARAATRSRTQGRAGGTEFRLRVMGTRPEDRIDPATIDPELRLDLLAKVQAVAPIEAGRNLFQFGAAPPPATPIPAVPKNVPKIAINPMASPMQTMAAKGPPAPPPAPPINLKYYGYRILKANGRKEAFLLDGDDILMAGENQTVKQRYKIVRIALTSIVIEDMQAKSTQTLKLQDLPG